MQQIPNFPLSSPIRSKKALKHVSYIQKLSTGRRWLPSLMTKVPGFIVKRPYTITALTKTAHGPTLARKAKSENGPYKRHWQI